MRAFSNLPLARSSYCDLKKLVEEVFDEDLENTDAEKNPEEKGCHGNIMGIS